jgi:hypothetical protein
MYIKLRTYKMQRITKPVNILNLKDTARLEAADAKV